MRSPSRPRLAYSQVKTVPDCLCINQTAHHALAQRPVVLSDNAHIEARFRTCKYTPGYPANGFTTIVAARGWVPRFVLWYNEAYWHSALAYVTPAQRHRVEDAAILARRREVYAAAQQRNPLRWKPNVCPRDAPGPV